MIPSDPHPPRVRVTFPAQASGAEPRGTAEERTGWIRARLERVGSGGTPMIASFDGELPEGALSWLIRDPAAEPERLVVLSLPHATDVVFDVALALFMSDEFHFPELTGRRVMSVFAQGPMRRETSEGVEWVDLASELAGSQGRTRVRIAGLMDSAPDAAPLHLPGLGDVRVLRFPQPFPLDL